VKIGFAKDPEDRLNQFQTGNAGELKLRVMFPGEIKEEQLLHSIFDHVRVRGEWFKYSPCVERFISEWVLAGDLCLAVKRLNSPLKEASQDKEYMKRGNRGVE